MRRRKIQLYQVKKWLVMFLVMIITMSSFYDSDVLAKVNRGDRTPPSTPLHLHTTLVTDLSVNLAWDVSTDNTAVTGYEIYKNKRLAGTSQTVTYQVNGLTPSTTYSFYVIAKDAAGNRSRSSNIITVTTAATASTTTVTPVPTATPIPTVTPVPAATVTPAPTATPVPTTTPIPTVTPVPTAIVTPAPTATPMPTATVTPTPTVTPTATPTPTVPSQKVIGYYAAWAAYSGFTPDMVDSEKLTHINYAFANIGGDYKIMLGYPDVDPANLAKLVSLKQSNPNLKVLIAVGGWSWSARFSDVALTDATRTIFADSCVDFIVKYGLDGIDIDWEYPVSGGLSTNIRRPEDKHNFTLLMQKLREKLDARGAIDNKQYLLSFAGAAGSWYLNNIEITKLIPYIDYANIMTYDLHGSWDPYTDFNAPLYNNTDTSPQYKDSVDQSVSTWLKAGFPADKLIMGVPFYGYLYKAVTNSNQGLYQTYSGASSISYANIAANYLNASGYVHYFHSQSKVPWLFNGSTFLSYEDEQSMSLKASYIKTKGLGGAMIWELSQDPNRILLNALYNGLK